MGKYEAIAKDIIKNVGGKDNINALTHCVTRLRFKLKDESKANDDVIKNMDGVVTLMKSGGQYQVVIGNHVPDVYAEVCTIAGISSGSSNDDEPQEKRGVGAVIMDYMSSIMNPILSVLCASGILKGVNTLILMAGLLEETDGLYMVLDAAGDTLLYFFPIFLGYTAATKFKMSPFLGAALGGSLVYPTIQSVEGMTIFGMDMGGVSYGSTVIPVILLIMVAAPCERWLKKVVPDVIKTFVVPMLILLVFAPLGYALIGPFANMLSDGLGSSIAGIYSFSPALCAIIIGAAWQILVIFGVHMGLAMILIVDLLAGNPSGPMAVMGVVSFSQTAVVFAIWLKSKDPKLKGIALPAWISGIFGVTEPAIYGVTLPRIKYFVISCIGGSVMGLYMAIANVAQYQMAGMGIFSIPGALSTENSSNVVHYCIAIVLGMAFSFVVTFILYKDDAPATSPQAAPTPAAPEVKSVKIAAPIKGRVVPLSEIKDDAFSQGLLGKGVAIEPVEGKVVAPEDGTLTTLFPTCHALGIQTVSGAEILIHIGMDTVQLEGKHFTAKAKQGDTVEKGQVIMEFDVDAIKAAGYSIATPVVITNTDAYADVVETSEATVNAGDTLIHLIK